MKVLLPEEMATDPGGATQPPAPSQPVLPQIVVLYALTLAAQFVSLAFGRANEELGFASIVLPSFVFLSALTLPACGLGIALGRRVGLGAPLVGALLSGESGSWRKLRSDVLLAGVLGSSLGGMLLLVRGISGPYLPPELPAFGHRGVVGGLSVSLGAAVAEEVWFRLGLMTLLVWCVARLVGDREARPRVVWPVLVVSSVGFGMAHLPQLMSYGADSPFAIGGTIVGNSVVGVLYGWCYWRRSLIAAMTAHFFVDLVLHAAPPVSTTERTSGS